MLMWLEFLFFNKCLLIVREKLNVFDWVEEKIFEICCIWKVLIYLILLGLLKEVLWYF